MDTWVLNLGGAPGSTGNYTWSSSDLSNYSGFFYYAMGAGGAGSAEFGNIQVLLGGGSGCVDSGYVDLSHPYKVSSINGIVNNQGPSQINITYTNDPTGGTYAFVIYGDASQTTDSNIITNYTNNMLVQATAPESLPPSIAPIGFYTGQVLNSNFDLSKNISAYTCNLCDQRGNIGSISSGTQSVDVSYSTISPQLFGVGGPFKYFGGGYYGGSIGVNGITGPYGYGCGGTYDQNPNISSYGTNGFIAISFIRKSSTNDGNFFTTLGSGSSNSSSGILIGSILAGGGGGSGNVDSNDNAMASGGGAGNPNLLINNVGNNSSYSYYVGAGGSGSVGSGGNSENGYPGEISSIIINGITGYANPGDGTQANDGGNGGFGGIGYYGGGSGSNSQPISLPGGFSCSGLLSHYGNFITEIAAPTPVWTNSYGAGSVDYNSYGVGYTNSDGNFSSGGGGGPYAGSGYGAGKQQDALGYGCGGGGGDDDSHNGGNGSQGYVLTRLITDSTNFKLITVSNGQSITLKYLDLVDYTGFWYFLSQGGNSLPLTNTGHFLIKQDGVKGIQLSFSNNSGTITVTFNPISLDGGNTTYLQTFKLSSAPQFLYNKSAVTGQDLGGGYTPPSYSAILLYKGTVNPS